MQSVLDEHGRHARRARALHADPHARVRREVAGSDHQHPPLVPARVHGWPALPPGPRARREDGRRHRALRDRRARRRPDHRPGRRARAATATRSRTSSAAAATSRSWCSPVRCTRTSNTASSSTAAARSSSTDSPPSLASARSRRGVQTRVSLSVDAVDAVAQ